MGTKNNPGKFDCYANAGADEPMFILLARDPLAPMLVEQWAKHRAGLVAAGVKPPDDMAKAYEAQDCAEAMRRWRAENKK